MISTISLKNIILIENLILNLSKGLNVFTGETGAGKSILLEGLSLALGARANFNLIGNYSDDAIVCIECKINKNFQLKDTLQELNIKFEDGIILKRIISSDGRSKSFINDQMVSLQTLSSIGKSLVEIQGQFETHDLINSKNNILYLDKFCKNYHLLANTKELFNLIKLKTKEIEKYEIELIEKKNVQKSLNQNLELLKEISPKKNEFSNLLTERKIVKNSSEIASSLEEVKNLLDGENNIKTLNIKSLSLLEKINDLTNDSYKEAFEALARATNEINEASYLINKSKEFIDNNSNRLEEIDDRVFELRNLSNRINEDPEKLSSVYEELIKKINDMDISSDHLLLKQNELLKLTDEFDEICKKLDSARKNGAKDLDLKIQCEFPFLNLEHATFKTEVIFDSNEVGNENGKNEVIFKASTNPNQKLGPLNKIASGGELSRFLLAVKVVLSNEDNPKTLIFDEVDSGIGGKTASAVGLRLKKLGDKNQVIVVTHSPQVAAAGDNHFLITKELEKGNNVTKCLKLNKNERQEEIARMLSGNIITDEARAAADSLLIS